MIRRAAWLSVGLLVPAAALGATCTTGTPSTATGHFYVQNGQIVGPDGTPFLARGVNDGNLVNNNAQQLLDTFPGLNFVRLPLGSYVDPASLADAIALLTSHGVVVELEDHTSSDGQDRGGGTGTIFTGTQLQNELSWYASLASYYKFNPLVWFGTDNEPSIVNPDTGQDDAALLSDWQRQTYDAIRGAGNNNPILLEINGWTDVNSFGQGYNPADYTGMTNVIGDVHDYGWLTNDSTDQAANDNFLSSAVSSLQSRLTTADGTLPVIIGEYGNSTFGADVDANGSQVVTAVNTSGLGSAAWNFDQGGQGGGDGLLNGDGSLSAYGQQVANDIAAGGCPAQPPSQNQLMTEVTPTLPNIQPLNQPAAPQTAAPNGPTFPTAPNPAPAPPMAATTPPQPLITPGVPAVPAADIPAGVGRPAVPTAGTPVAVRAPDVVQYPVGVPDLVLPPIAPIPPLPTAGPTVNTLITVANRGLSMLASPIGTWLVKMDGAIVGGMDAALQGLMPQLVAPVASMCVLFLATRGVRIAQGDANALHNLWFNLVKIGVVVGLTTNLANFDYYVRGLFYTNLPNLLTQAVGGQLVTNGVNGTAATFDTIWAETWLLIAKVWQQAGYFDVGSRLSAAFSGLTVGAALMAMALVYLLARLLLGIVIVLGPVCIACTLFEQTKPIFERWMGKVIALICLQVAGVVLLTILLAADKDFMAQIQPIATQAGTGTFGASGAPSPTVASDTENLVAMVVWFGMGAFAMYALPAIAYSIGTGVATSMMPLALGLFSAAKAVSQGVSGLLGAGVGAAGEAAGEMSLGFARDELTTGSGDLSLPPPPPPALSHATPPVGGD